MITSNKMINISNILLIVFCLPFSILAQTSSTQSSTDKDSAKFDPIVFRDYVNSAIEKVSGMEKSKAKGIDICAYSNEFKIISQNAQVEKIMYIRSDWFLDISKLLNEMSKYKTEMEVAEERALKERMDKAKKIYEELEKKLKQLLDHPVKVNKK